MGIEIERKFLVDIEQWQQLAKPAGISIKQGYIINSVDKTLRLRIAGKRAYLTFKSGAIGIIRSEYEYEIAVNDGIELLDKFTPGYIQKTRYCVSFKNKVWEVDVFLGDNEGLVVAEIELERENEAVELPPWVQQEVTAEEKYYNAALSIHPFKNWYNK